MFTTYKRTYSKRLFLPPKHKIQERKWYLQFVDNAQVILRHLFHDSVVNFYDSCFLEWAHKSANQSQNKHFA
jgi:hypothetical protein